MVDHGSVGLGPGGRRRIVEAVEAGMTQKLAAERFCVSPATVNRWVVRARRASSQERSSGACFAGRSSHPRRSPRRLPDGDHDRVCAVRERTGWGAEVDRVRGRDPARDGSPSSASPRALETPPGSTRAGAPLRVAVPGKPVHMDTKRHARFAQPGHAVTGDRRRQSRGAGWEYVHTLEDVEGPRFVDLHKTRGVHPPPRGASVQAPRPRQSRT